MRKLGKGGRRRTVFIVLFVVLSVRVLSPPPVVLTVSCLLGPQRPAGRLRAFVIGWFTLKYSSDHTKAVMCYSLR